MQNNKTLGKVVLGLWLSSLIPFIAFSFISRLLTEAPIISGELFFLFIGPSIYMYFFKRKYNHYFSLSFSRKVANYFIWSFIIIYFSIAALYTYNLDTESIDKLYDNIILLCICLLVIFFAIYSFGRIGLTFMLSDQAGNIEINYVKYIAIFIAFSALGSLIYMVSTTISNEQLAQGGKLTLNFYGIFNVHY